MNRSEQPPGRTIKPADTHARSLAGFFKEPAFWRIVLPFLALVLVANAGLARFGPKDHPISDSRSSSTAASGPITPSAAPESLALVANTPPATPIATLVPPPLVAAPPSVAASTETPPRQRVVDAEAALRSGEVATMIGYPNGNTTSVRTRFDLGDARTPARLQSVSTYHGAFGDQTVERIMVDEQTWQRQGTGPWAETADDGTVAEQVRGLLPNLVAATGVKTEQRGEKIEMRWFDAGRGAEMTLEADAATGRAQQLQASVAATGVGVTWTYDGWGTAVAIFPPTPG